MEVVSLHEIYSTSPCSLTKVIHTIVGKCMVPDRLGRPDGYGLSGAAITVYIFQVTHSSAYLYVKISIKQTVDP